MNRVRARREQLRWRVEDLAAKADISYSTARRIEAGSVTTTDVARRVADALNASLDDLFPPQAGVVDRGPRSRTRRAA
jgi:transcriptional regulator with XRE-family HTH domain